MQSGTSNHVTGDMRSRIDRNARQRRTISRAEIFQKNRQNQNQELSYLKVLPAGDREAILASTSQPIPSPLPSVSPLTISYFRRSNEPIFQTALSENSPEAHPHMVYESLYILAALPEGSFKHYQQIVKDFETKLELYLGCEWPEIREMAMIVAGNKIIGKETQILKMVQMDIKQLWVLINHIYERKISVTHLFEHLGKDQEIAFRSLFELSNSKEDEVIEQIMARDQVITTLVDGLQHYNPEIKLLCVRILGNILAEKEEYCHALNKYNILSSLLPFLSSSSPEVRKDVCWALSNFAFEKAPSNSVINNSSLIEKLTSMLGCEKLNSVRLQLMYIFLHLVVFADKKLAFELINNASLLKACNRFLEIDDIELNNICLELIIKVIEVGNHFADDFEEGNDHRGNFFINQIRHQEELRNLIMEKAYSEDKEISKLSSEIEEKLEEDD